MFGKTNERDTLNFFSLVLICKEKLDQWRGVSQRGSKGEVLGGVLQRCPMSREKGKKIPRSHVPAELMWGGNKKKKVNGRKGAPVSCKRNE